MIQKSSYEVIEIAGEYMAVPIGEAAAAFNGIIALNDASAFLLNELKQGKSVDELVAALTDNFDVDKETASTDVHAFLEKLQDIGLVKLN